MNVEQWANSSVNVQKTKKNSLEKNVTQRFAYGPSFSKQSAFTVISVDVCSDCTWVQTKYTDIAVCSQSLLQRDCKHYLKIGK